MPQAKSQISHTPGPWECRLDDDGETWGVTFVIRMASNRGGRQGWEPQHRIEYGAPSREKSPQQFGEAAANARLITAAPELLAALKAIVAVLRQEAPGTALNHHKYDAIGIQAHAALAKAEGR